MSDYYQNIADELSNPEYASFRDDPATCIAIMQGKSTEVYNAFEIGRWSEDMQQRGTPQGVYKANLQANKDSTTPLADGRTLGAVCTDLLNALDGNTLSTVVDYTDDEIRGNMDGTLQELVNNNILDLVIFDKMRSHGVTDSNVWLDLGSPTEGDILYSWTLVP